MVWCTVYSASTVDNNNMPKHQTLSIKEKLEVVRTVERGMKKRAAVGEKNLLLSVVYTFSSSQMAITLKDEDDDFTESGK